MRIPNGLRPDIISANRLHIIQRGNRSAHKACINAGNGLSLAWPIQAADTAIERPQQGQNGDNAVSPNDLKREEILPAKDQRREREKQNGPERPEIFGHTFSDQPQSGQQNGHFQMPWRWTYGVQWVSPDASAVIATPVRYLD